MVNNIYIIVTGCDTSTKPKHQCDWFIRLLLKFVVTVLPIGAAFLMANLIQIIKLTGFISFTSYLVPIILQVRSIHVCRKKLPKYHMHISPARKNNVDRQSNKKEMDSRRKCYVTPYSYSVISHPVTGLLMTAVGICLLVFLIVDLFVPPSKLTCSTQS